jgi:hypothetical protein
VTRGEGTGPEADRDFAGDAARNRRESLASFGVKPWQAGFGSLPRRTRLRLWFDRQVDGTAIWLVCHGHFRAAERTWRLFGKW